MLRSLVSPALFALHKPACEILDTNYNFVSFIDIKYQKRNLPTVSVLLFSASSIPSPPLTTWQMSAPPG